MDIQEIITRAQGSWDTADQLFVVNGITGKSTPRQLVYLGTRLEGSFHGVVIQVNGSASPVISGNEVAALVAHALREVLRRPAEVLRPLGSQATSHNLPTQSTEPTHLPPGKGG